MRVELDKQREKAIGGGGGGGGGERRRTLSLAASSNLLKKGELWLCLAKNFELHLGFFCAL